jgi:hypothetical protein
MLLRYGMLMSMYVVLDRMFVLWMIVTSRYVLLRREKMPKTSEEPGEQHPLLHEADLLMRCQ